MMYDSDTQKSQKKRGFVAQTYFSKQVAVLLQMLAKEQETTWTLILAQLGEAFTLSQIPKSQIGQKTLELLKSGPKNTFEVAEHLGVDPEVGTFVLEALAGQGFVKFAGLRFACKHLARAYVLTEG